jgi:hypothetical protein
MEDMSREVALLVVEQVDGLRELTRLRGVCRWWRETVDVGFASWVRLQVAGTVSERFSFAELLLVRDHLDGKFSVIFSV